MNKREFLKKSGIAAISMLVANACKSQDNPAGVNNGNVVVDEMRSAEASNMIVGDPSMKLVIGSDHAGFPLKGILIERLKLWNYDVTDVGSFTPDPVDFPDIAIALADRIITKKAERGIMVCGTGVGASIACNKIQGIRAALCHDTFSAYQGVDHDNVNVLCIGGWIIGQALAEEILKNFLSAKFNTAEQFRRRVEKVDAFDLVPPV